MSVKFVNYTVVPYAGTLSGLNVGICTPSSYVPRVVPIVIDWSKYPSGGVQVNLNAQGILNPIDFIRSVVIDNLQQGSSIEIQFPDTNFTIVCPGNDILSAFAFTFQLNVLIFNTGSPLVNTTTVYLCNFLVDTYLQSSIQEIVSLGAVTSTALGNQSFAAPALGTQKSVITFPLSTVNVPNLLFGGARLSGSIFITSTHVKILGNYSPNPGPLAMIIQISNNLAQQVAVWQFYSPNDMSIFPMLIIGDEQNTQSILPATNAYTIQNIGNAAPGFCEYTTFWDWVDSAA